LPERRARQLVAVLAAALAMSIGAPMAWGQMSSAGSARHLLSTDTLLAPTSPAAANGPCTLGVAASVTVSWTATRSTWADGYVVLGSLLSGGPYTTAATVSGQSTTSVTVTGLAFVTTYYYVVQATKGAWRSPSTAEVSRTTLSPLCR
jgi:hypothetical protein